MISILDNDLYKFSTSYAYMKLFPEARGTFQFVDRNKIPRTEEFLDNYRKELKSLSEVKLTNDEKEWCINNIPYIPSCYWEWLSSFTYDSDKFYAYLDKDNVLNVLVTDYLYKATLWEIPCLYSVTEVANKDKVVKAYSDFYKKIQSKIEFANSNLLNFSEFGTRRRFSFNIQNSVCLYLKKYSKTCVGTSNVYFAMRYDMKPIGTHPHEWFMFHGAIYGYRQANYLALENWVKVYDGDLGIALTDTFGTDAFFEQMSLKQAKLFDGLRQDSGSVIEFINKAVNFYNEKEIDPTTKVLVFSDALDFDKALKIKIYCDNRGLKCSFGIGTNLTNDVGYPPENIVMKLCVCQINKDKLGRNCVKLSDDEGKEFGLEREINIAYDSL